MPSPMGCVGQELAGCSGAGTVAPTVVARGYRGTGSKARARGVAGGDVWLRGPYTPKGPAAVAAVTTERPTRALAR